MSNVAETVERGMLFGMDHTLVAVSIMVVTFLIIFTEKINRAITVIFGASLMIIVGVLSQDAAVASIDFNTLALLVGMMIIVSVAEKTGIFQYIAVWSAKKVNGSPRGILAALAIVTAILSGIVDCVTAVFLMTPIIFQITRRLGVRPFPYLMLTIFACNIGGAATLVGNPPNILVGSAANLHFVDFIQNMMPISYLMVAILIVSFDFIWGRKIVASPEAVALVMQMNEKDTITDRTLLIKSLSVLGGVVIGLVFAHALHLETGTIAMFGAGVLMFLYTRGLRHQEVDGKVEEVLSLVDWTTIFFFMGLFIVVHGLETTGLLTQAGHVFVEISGGLVNRLIFIFLWTATFASCLMDNIPFVATMVPIIKAIEADMGGREAVAPIWWALMMGACYGGNGTLIASSANVVVAGIAMKEGNHISFMRFFIWGFPVTIVSVIIASIYLYFRYPAFTHVVGG